MGIVKRQSIKNSLVNYGAMGIGVLSTLFVYPLNWHAYGTIQYWIASATLLTPILRLGSTALINKFYPEFNKQGIAGFFGLICLITTGTILATSIFLGLGIWIVGFTVEDPGLFQLNQENFIIYILAVLAIFTSILHFFASNLHRIVIPDLINVLKLRIGIPLIILAIYFQVIREGDIAKYLILFYLLGIVANTLYLHRLKGLDLRKIEFSKISLGLKKRMTSFWVFGGLNYLGVIMAYKLDNIMIGSLISKTAVGYYSVFLVLASIIDIPFKAISKISSPIISKFFNENKLTEIHAIYKQAATSLTVVSLVIFTLIWTNMDDLMSIMKNGEDIRPYQTIFLLLASAKMIDMLSSVNNLIIIYSKWYRYNLFFLVFLAVSNLIMNYYLIGEYGIMGAAYATAIAILAFNLIKGVFVYVKLNMHPFSWPLIKMTLIFGLVFCGALLIDVPLNPVPAIVIKGSITASVFGGLIYLFKPIKL